MYQTSLNTAETSLHVPLASPADFDGFDDRPVFAASLHADDCTCRLMSRLLGRDDSSGALLCLSVMRF